MLEYELVGEDAFKIMTYYGLGFIVVNQDLDYEQTQSYYFMVSGMRRLLRDGQDGLLELSILCIHLREST